LRITVDDVGAATPDVVAAVEQHGGEVASAREERPSFDEVFSRLVEREQAKPRDDRERERDTQSDTADDARAR
jgi:hypothetical protein